MVHQFVQCSIRILTRYERILTHGQNIPEGAIVGGEHHGRPIYIARAYYEGGIREFFLSILIVQDSIQRFRGWKGWATI